LGGERENRSKLCNLGTKTSSTSVTPLNGFVPEVRIVDIPFLFTCLTTTTFFVDGRTGCPRSAKKMQNKGLINLAMTEERLSSHMTNSKRAINTPEGMPGGLKMR
jgi:TRAP-type C4-dicarboxylate transport system substrate-binding protein